MNDENDARPLDQTGERFIPGMPGQIRYEHWHRYAICSEWVRDKDVLDIACGEGYGSAHLARWARSVTGVDIDSQAILSARRTYGAHHANLAFEVGRADRIPLSPASVDIVVSFETIEHHAQHQEMLAEVRRVLKPQGILIISSPDKRTYSDEPATRNEFHVKELGLNEFDALLRAHFRHVSLSGQRMGAASFLAALPGSPETPRAVPSDYRGWTVTASGDVEARAEGLPDPIYIVAVCSDIAQPALGPSLYIDSMDDLFAEQAKALSWAAGVEQARHAATLDRDIALIARDAALRERDAALSECHAAVAERDRQITRLGGALALYDRQLRGTMAIASPLSEGEASEEDRLLRESPLFDAEFYCARNPDVVAAGIDPCVHYLRYGAAERRDPHPLFQTAFYLDANPDVAALAINPLVHFIRIGAAEGRPMNDFTGPEPLVAPADE